MLVYKKIELKNNIIFQFDWYKNGREVHILND